jgi:hypothetical protein
MTTTPTLPVAGTVVQAWKLVLVRPRYAIRTGWIPALAIFGIGAAFGGVNAGGTDPGEAFWEMIAAIANFALLALALVAWQRSALPHAKLRKGSSALRLGRAEVLAMLHFPLIGVLFIPLLLPALAEILLPMVQRGGVGGDAVLPLAVVVVLIFPGGLLLTRATLILVAIAEAGQHAIPLMDTANRVWRLGGGSSIRLLLVLYLSAIPVVAAMMVVPDTLPDLARAAVSGILLTLYVLIAGGALSLAYAALGGAQVPAALRKARRGAT